MAHTQLRYRNQKHAALRPIYYSKCAVMMTLALFLSLHATAQSPTLPIDTIETEQYADPELAVAVRNAASRVQTTQQESLEVDPYYFQVTGITATGQIIVHYTYTSDLNGIRFIAKKSDGKWVVSIEDEKQFNEWNRAYQQSLPERPLSISYDRVAAVHWAAQAGGPVGDSAFWNQRGNYRDGHARGVGCTSWAGCDIGRHCTTYVARALYSGGLNVDWGFVGNHQLIAWMNANPDKWTRMFDSNQLEAGDFILINWKRDGQAPITTWADHSVLVTGSNQYAQWNNETWGNSISGLLPSAYDWWGIHINTAGTATAPQVVSADYDGDDRVDLSTKANNGEWHIDFASNSFGSWDATFTGMGDNSSVFVPADYNGDGKADFSMKSPAGDWYIDYAPSFGSWNAILPGFGDNSSFYLPGDFNGDGTDDLSMKSPTGDWYIDYGPSFGGWNDIFHGMGDNSSFYLPGDFNGDGTDDLSMKSPAGDWYIDYGPSFGGWNDIFHGMGDNSSIYFVGDFNGDGEDDLSMKSPAGDWYMDLSPFFGNWDHISHGYGDHSSSYRAGKYDADDMADLFMVAPSGDLYVDYACNGFGSWDALNLDCTNHLTNYSFEIAGSTNRLAQTWTGVGLRTSDRRACTTVSKPVATVDGNCVFQFNGGSTDFPARKLQQVIVPVGWGNAGETLTISAQVAGTKFKAGARIQLKVVYTDGSVVKKNVAVPSGTYEFVKIAGAQALNKTIKKVIVAFDVKQVAGRLFVDDVRLSVSSTALRSNGVVAIPPPAVPNGFRGDN